MAEIGNAELQKYHYKSLRENHQYLMDFKLDILREEIMMQMPIVPDISGLVERIEKLEYELEILKGSNVKVIYKYLQPIIGKPDTKQWI